MISEESDVYRRWTWLCIGLIGAGCMIGIAVPAGLGWDFANFYDAGRRIAAGQVTDLYSPLSLIDGQTPQGSTGFFGAPLSALFYTPLAAFSAGTALVVFKIQNVLAFGATFAVLLKFYRPFVSASPQEQSRFTALFAFLFLIYQPFWTIFRVGGQTTPTVLLLLSLGLVAHTRGLLWASAGCIVIAALIKPALAPAVVLLAGITGVAFFWRMAALWLATGALSVILLGWPVHMCFLDLMLKSSRVEYSWYYNSSLYTVIDVLRASAGQAASSGVLYALFLILTYGLRGAVVLTMVWIAWQGRSRQLTASAQRHLHFLLVLVFFLAWSPTLFEHYLSLLFPFLIYVVAARKYFSRQALVLVGLIFAFSLWQNLILINWLRYGFEFDTLPELVGITLFKSAPVLLTMVLLWRHAGEFLQSHTASTWTHDGAPATQESA